MRRGVQLLVCVIALCSARVALACPYCAGRAGGGTGIAVLIAAIITLPFPAAYIILRVVRRGQEIDAAFESPPPAGGTPQGETR